MLSPWVVYSTKSTDWAWPYTHKRSMVSDFLTSADIKAFTLNAASNWPHTKFIPRVFLLSIRITTFCILAIFGLK